MGDQLDTTDDESGGVGALPSADELLVIDRAVVGETVVLTLTGDLDSATASQLHAAVLDELHQPGHGPLVLDMTAVTFLSAAGLGALIDAHHDAIDHAEPLRVVVDHARPVLRPLQLTGLDQVLTLYHFLDNALRGDLAAEGHDGDAGDAGPI